MGLELLNHLDYINKIVIKCNEFVVKPGSHTSPTIGEPWSVIIQGKSQGIEFTTAHRHRSSLTSAMYENQA